MQHMQPPKKKKPPFPEVLLRGFFLKISRRRISLDS